MRERKDWLMLAGGILALVALGWTGYWMLFTTFMAHDDEGYVLWSVREFCAGKPLYAEVYSQYGPFFYAWYRGWHALTGLVFTSESARWLTLGHWLMAVGSCGYLAARLTRQWLVGIAASMLSFAALGEMIREPFHPGGFLAALAALATAAGFSLLERRAVRGFVLNGTAFGMAMALTKINVGAFFLVALGSWMLLQMGGRKVPRTAVALVALGVIAAPLVLMKMHLEDDWVQTFGVVFIASGLALLLQVRTVGEKGWSWQLWGWMAAVAGVFLVGMAAFGAVTGTSLAQLWEGVVAGPLQHPGVIVYAVLWRDGTTLAAILALGLALVPKAWSARLPWWPLALAVLRLVGGLAVLWQLTGLGGDLPFQAVFQFAPALAWLMATPLRSGGQEETSRGGRSWLAWCALWQILQAYPVAGSQVSWGCFLFVPLLVAGCYEAFCFLGEKLRRPQIAQGTGVAVLAAWAVITTLQLAFPALLAWQEHEPLGLAGARSLHLPRRLASEAQALSHNVALHGDLLFSTPGMFSFNLWSERPTPTAANVTVWGSLLSEGQKGAIFARLAQEPRAMVISRITGPRIYNPDNFLGTFQPLISVGDYMLWVGKGRTCLPLGLVHYRRTPEGHIYLLLAAEPSERLISGLVVREIEQRQVIARFGVEPGRSWLAIPVDLQAHPQAAARNVAAPFALPGYTLVQVEIDSSLAGLNTDKIDAVLTDASGATVESFRFNKVGQEGDFLPK